MRSLNLLFDGRGPRGAQAEDPPGGPWIRALGADLGAAGWTVEEPDIWRDSGWSMGCRRAGSEVLVALAEAGQGGDWWLLQIRPDRLPGAIMRWAGRQPSASPGDCYQVALVIHGTVQRAAHGVTYWRWDGFPDVDRSSPTPPAAADGEPG